ncbi:MAG: outer membrane lipoprotein carrier protein LolA [Bdellovibrionales bacterium]|nr:outer membrane lipoprotein carrier protein LolA [Bdellovibrionales bacterium]
MSLKAAFAFCLISSLAMAKTAAPSGVAEVDSVLAKYRKAPAIQAEVKKTVVQEVMGTSHESEGKFYFSKGKLRLDIEKPEKSILVYDGKNIWLESRLDEKTVEVSRIRSGDIKKTDSLMAALFDRRDVLQGFKLLKVTNKDGQKTFAFEPKDTKKTEVRHLEVALQNKDIRRITYKDNMENQVTFEFSSLSRGKVPAGKFTYKPPKGANVTEL